MVVLRIIGHLGALLEGPDDGTRFDIRRTYTYSLVVVPTNHHARLERITGAV
jgi:hypothetical protein